MLDPDYLAFVESLNKAEEPPPSIETHLEEIEAKKCKYYYVHKFNNFELKQRFKYWTSPKTKHMCTSKLINHNLLFFCSVALVLAYVKFGMNLTITLGSDENVLPGGMGEG